MPYNTVTVVLITEALKLLLSGSIYMRDNTVVSLGEGILKNKNVLGLYFVPAALYCLYNNLAFVSLSFFNPTTYFMFMQIRLLLTGLIYQVNSRMRLGSKREGIRKKLITWYAPTYMYPLGIAYSRISISIKMDHKFGPRIPGTDIIAAKM